MSHVMTKDKTKIYYRDQGTGTPVILIHGWPVNSDMFEYQTVPLLEAGFRVISYDRRGFGKSAQPATGYDYDTFASDLNDLINQLELQKVGLVGFSMGGGEIARFLSRYGTEKISRVALVSSVVPYVMKDDTNPNGVPLEKLEEMKTNLREDRPKFLSVFGKDFFGTHLLSSAVSNQILDWTSFMAFAASPKATIDCVDAFGKTDFRQDLEAFTIPTLIVHGSSDKTVPMVCSGEAAAQRIAGSIFKVYDGAPHGLFVTHKRELAQDLIAFFRGQEADIALEPRYNENEIGAEANIEPTM